MKIKNAKEKLITCLLIAVIVAVMYLFHIPCPFKAIFSIPCPGCGMTRAYLSLLSFDFVKALEYNPMFWSVPVLLVFYFFDGRVFKKNWINAFVLCSVLAGFFLSWIIRLFI